MRILENEALKVCVADHGAELSSVTDKATGAERIWTADPAVWNRHAPVLFPFVGKVMNGKYRIGEEAFCMKTQHGFARDRDFICEEEDPEKIIHTLCSDDASKAIYPYDFRLSVSHTLDGTEPRTLWIGWRVENTGDVPMYFQIGGHPGFLLPEGTEKKDCLFFFPGKKELRYYSVNPQGFALPDTVMGFKPEMGYVPFDESAADTWIFEDGQVQSVSICSEDGTPHITLRCPGFPYLAVWSKPGAPFICLEPWYGRTDDEGFSGTLAEKPGMQILEPGARAEYCYSITFH